MAADPPAGPVRPAGPLIRVGAPLLVIMLWGSLPVANKMGVSHYPPLQFAAVRALLASALMAAFLLLLRPTRTRAFFARLRARDWTYLALVGVLQTSVFFYAVSVGVSLVAASVAAVLINTQPLFTVLLAKVVLGERLTGRTVAGLVCALAFIPLVTLADLTDLTGSAGGYLVLIGGAICWAAAILLYKKTLAGLGEPLIATAAQLWTGTVVLALLTLSTVGTHWATPDPKTAYSIGYTVVFGTCIPYVLWFMLLGRLPAGYLSMFTFLMPVIGVLLGYLLLAERLRPVQLVGVVGVVCGVLLTLIGGKPRLTAGAVAGSVGGVGDRLQEHVAREPAVLRPPGDRTSGE